MSNAIRFINTLLTLEDHHGEILLAQSHLSIQKQFHQLLVAFFENHNLGEIEFLNKQVTHEIIKKKRPELSGKLWFGINNNKLNTVFNDEEKTKIIKNLSHILTEIYCSPASFIANTNDPINLFILNFSKSKEKQIQIFKDLFHNNFGQIDESSDKGKTLNLLRQMANVFQGFIEHDPEISQKKNSIRNTELLLNGLGTAITSLALIACTMFSIVQLYKLSRVPRAINNLLVQNLLQISTKGLIISSIILVAGHTLSTVGKIYNNDKNLEFLQTANNDLNPSTSRKLLSNKTKSFLEIAKKAKSQLSSDGQYYNVTY